MSLLAEMEESCLLFSCKNHEVISTFILVRRGTRLIAFSMVNTSSVYLELKAKVSQPGLVCVYKFSSAGYREVYEGRIQQEVRYAVSSW